MAYSDEQGIQAIIDLQSIAGIEEDYEDAKESWFKFDDIQKRITEQTHRLFFNGNHA